MQSITNIINNEDIFYNIGQFSNTRDLLMLNFVSTASHNACKIHLKEPKFSQKETQRYLKTGNKVINYLGKDGLTRSDYKPIAMFILTDLEGNQKKAYVLQHKNTTCIVVDGLAYGLEVIDKKTFIAASTILRDRDNDETSYIYSRSTTGKIEIFEGSFERKFTKTSTQVTIAPIMGRNITCDNSIFRDFSYPAYQQVVVLDSTTSTVYNKYFEKLYTYTKQQI